ncbi:hypothetical protein C8J57DRAFT_1511153 [Mycena rebaudengoi]|nr:hypothetical protein C8J57DRAFT_1511153 [Mycena rebaudengoi]
MGTMLYTWICVGGMNFALPVVLPPTIAPPALELSKHLQNIHSQFIVLVLCPQMPRPTAVLKTFEYIDIFVLDSAEHALRIRGKPSEADFQTVLEATKEADIRTSDGASCLLRGMSVLLRPSTLIKDGNSDREITIKSIINEGRSIKEIVREEEIAGTLPCPLA